MKSFLFGISIGTLLTASICLSLYFLSDNTSALSTLDMLIDEWTADGIDSTEIVTAQIPAAKELPDARPGYFPDTVIALANQVQQKYYVPKGVVLAQWTLESNWGRNNLGVSNYFGHTIQATRRFIQKPDSILLPELIHSKGKIRSGRPTYFSVYKNMAECFDVHGQYLAHSSLYRKAFEKRYYNNPEKFARSIGPIYASDPDYAIKLIAIMRRYKL